MATATRLLHRSISTEVSGRSSRKLSRSSDNNLVPLGLQQKASSDSNLVRHFLCHRSSLTVDREQYMLGSGDKVTVLWDIQEDVSSNDWIGLFLVGERDPSKNIDYRSRGDSGTRHGEISWCLDQVDYNFDEAATKTCFRYYHGGKYELLASSDTLVIKKRPEPVEEASSPELLPGDNQLHTSPRQLYCLTVSRIAAHCLKKGMFFNPDPYVKLSVQPGNRASLPRLGHHGQQVKTSIQANTTNPDWSADGDLYFKVLPSDCLEFVVKDKFAKSRPTISRFLGKLSVPVQKTLNTTQDGSTTSSYNLMRRNPSDNVSGYLLFTLNISQHADTTESVCSIARRNAVKVRHSPSLDNSSPAMSPLRSRRRLEPPHANETSTDHDDYEQATISLSALSRGRLSDSLRISEDMLSCSPPCIAVVPGIECGSYDEAGVPQLHDGSPAHGRAKVVFDEVEICDSEVAQEASRLDRSDAVVTASGGISISDPPPPLPPKTKVRSLDRRIPQDHSNDLNCDVRASSPPDSISSRENSRPRVARRPRVHSESVSSTASSCSNDEERSSIDAACASPTRSEASGGHASPVRSNMSSPVRASVCPPTRVRVLSLSDQLARIPNIESAISPDMSTIGHSFLYRAARHASSPDAHSVTAAKPANAQIVVTSRIVNRRSSSPVAMETPQLCVAATPQLSRDSICDDTTDASSVAQTNGDSVPSADFESSADRPTESNLVAEAELLPVLPPRRLRPDRSPSRLQQRRIRQHSPSTPPSPSGRDRVVPPEVAPRNGASTLPQLPPRNGASILPELPPRTVTSSPTMSSNVPVQEQSSLEEDSTTTEDLITTDGIRDTSSRSRGITTTSTMPPAVPAVPAANHTLSQTTDSHLPPIAENGDVQVQVMDPGSTDGPQSTDGPLPRGWEARVDSHGRVFYIDHINRTTTWHRPQFIVHAPQRAPSISAEEREQMDRRYQSISRTMSEMTAEAEAEDTTDGPPTDVETPTAGGSLMKLPAVKFITRPDIFTLIQENDTAIMEYNQNSTLKHMINKIRRDPQVFDRYQHNRDLVTFLNLFADSTKELPRLWEMKYDRSAKPFFIDHNSKKTTFIDPRLPLEAPLTRSRALIGQLSRQRSHSLDDDTRASSRGGRPESRRTVTAAVPVEYNEKVVAFLRTPNISDILKAKNDVFRVTPSLWTKLSMIRNEGHDALVRLSNDVELIILLSLFENEILSFVPASFTGTGNISPQDSPHNSPALQRANLHVPAPYKRDFQAKLRTFRRKLEARGYGQGPGKFKLAVRRDHVLEDAFNKIMSASRRELQRNKLYISFSGEEGLDYGGPSREFFFLLSRELFNPYYGLFEYSANDTYTVQISPMSTFVENAHQWFQFAGRVIALCLVHQYLLDAFFTRPFYKFLLRMQSSLIDLESLDAEFHQSLLWIKDNDITDLDLGLTFSVDEEVFGQVTERELKPNGKNIAITEKNKKDYIDKMVRWRLDRGVSEQRESVIRGFYEVIDARLVSIFDAKELELVTAGTVEIDVSEWRKYTEYRAGYHDHHQVVQWFWMAVERYDNERRLRLLQFVTGTSSIPYEGFSALRGSNGPRKFCIEKWGKINSLPRSHTCFNRLDLPPYTSFEMLFEKLTIAVEETSTFGIE